MALVESLIGRMSGKLGNMVFSRNKGGAYIRTRVTPTNPNSTFQQTVRSAVSQLSNRWLNVLSAAQRAAWETYATNVTLLNRLGYPVHITGLAHYVRSNTPRVQLIGPTAIVDNAPTTFDLGDYTEPVLTMNTTSEINIAFTEADDWVSEDGAYMLVYSSREQNPSINYFKGPYRIADAAVVGASALPPTTPETANSAFPVADGNRVFFFVRVSRADGRLSTPWYGSDTPSFV